MELTAEGPGEARADHRMDRVFGLSRALKLRVANARAGEESEVLCGVRVVLPHQIHLSHLPVVLLHAVPGRVVLRADDTEVSCPVTVKVVTDTGVPAAV